MATIDLEKLLEPLPGDSPCGEDLEYDPAFGELERTARGREERRSGDQVIPAEDPNWRDVAEAAHSLFERTRDLRVALYLTHAALNLEGLPGLASGLRLVHGLLVNHWDAVHPGLDKDDNDDPTLRINSLAALDDRAGLLRSLGRVPLVASRAVGRFGLRDLRLAAGELTPGESEIVPAASLVDAAFLDCDLDELKATAAGAANAAAALEETLAVLTDRVGSGRVPNFEALTKELHAVRSILGRQLERRGVGGAAAGADTGTVGGAKAAGLPGEIRSREDAIRMLDKIGEFFHNSEPSSPVPLILQRAKRLVSKDFMEILQDLTPDAVTQAEHIVGLKRE